MLLLGAIDLGKVVVYIVLKNFVIQFCRHYPHPRFLIHPSEREPIRHL